MSNGQEELTSPSDVLNKLATALTVISRGDPLTSLRSEIETKLASFVSRFEAIDRATISKLEFLMEQHQKSEQQRPVMALPPALSGKGG